MEIGAQAAISGYRLQALYTASLLLGRTGEGRVFEPEGKEDLAVYAGGKLERVLQVKAYSAPLTLSDLEPQKPRSFFRRVLELKNKDVAIELVTFGPLGPELQSVHERQETALATVRKKLLAQGYAPPEADEILRRLTIVRVDEATVRDAVFDVLSRALTAGDPDRAFELIVWWILQMAEQRLRITPHDLRDRLNDVGKYFSERGAHHQEWFTTIKPLVASDRPEELSKEHLEREYYLGAAARYSHIQAGLDVRRTEHLERIEELFRSGKRVVIIHGASGQGKTSLALRYLHEAVPDDWRFLITAVDDRRHAARIANAIADHLHSLKSPIYLLLDVAPRDLDWVSLIRGLLDIENVRILVAIREEDLARRTATERELGFPADLHLEFSEPEAKTLYNQLVERGDAPNAFPTFAEAWDRFGGRGPLLEFVHLVTQTESLRSVLQGQVRRLREEVRSGKLQPEALRLLHSCAVATAFEARVRLEPLAASLELRDPVSVIVLFENEYLLRLSADRRYILALHPVRSGLLSEILDDPAFAPSMQVALETFPLIPEEDLEVFTLYLLSRYPDSWVLLEERLRTLELSTWNGAAGLGRALLWWGIRCYLDENRTSLDEAERVGGDSWPGLLLGDVAGAGESDLAGSMLELLERSSPEAAARLREIRSGLSSTSSIFAPLERWLETLNLSAPPQEALDWEGFAELIFWRGRLQLPLPDLVDPLVIPVDKLPIELVSQISLALSTAMPEQQACLVATQGEAIRRRFQCETDTVLLDEDDSSITAHFVVPFDLLPGLGELAYVKPPNGIGRRNVRLEAQPQGLRQESRDEDEGLGTKLNREAVRRAGLLRSLFPSKERYCTQGHGHQVPYGGLDLIPHDETVKRMPPSALLPPWLTRVNAVTNSLAIYGKRPASWRLYARTLLDIRETVATSLLKLQRALTKYFEHSTPRSLFGETLSEEQWQEARKAAGTVPHLPLSAVDEWGLSSETQRQRPGSVSGLSSNIATAFVLRRHASFARAISDYATAAHNFFNAAETLLVVHGIAGRSPQTRTEILATAEARFGYGEEKIRLSKHNLFQVMSAMNPMQKAFEERVGGLVDAVKLAQVKRREESLFPELWALWFQFSESPERLFSAAGPEAMDAFQNELRWLRERLQQALQATGSWSASILTERLSWEGLPALVLRLDLASIASLEEARAGILALLGHALGGHSLGSLRQYALDYYWPRILVVPTLEGLALEEGAWVVPSFVVSHHDGDASPDRPWLRSLHRLSGEQLRELGLEASTLSKVPSLNELQERFGQLQVLYAHAASFGELIPSLDALGRQVLENYLATVARQLGACADEVLRLLPLAISAVRQSTILDESIVDALLDPLVEMQSQLDGERGRTIRIDIGDCSRKAEQVQELTGSLAVLRWLSVPGAIESLQPRELR